MEPFAQARDAVWRNKPLEPEPPVADPSHVRLALSYAEQRFPQEWAGHHAAFERVLTEFCKNHRADLDRECQHGYITGFRDITDQLALHCRAAGRDHSTPESPEAWIPLDQLP